MRWGTLSSHAGVGIRAGTLLRRGDTVSILLIVRLQAGLGRLEVTRGNRESLDPVRPLCESNHLYGAWELSVFPLDFAASGRETSPRDEPESTADPD